MSRKKAKNDEDLNVPASVVEIRKQWLVHEDEAFAYKLQNEEIHQHYDGNRSRNACLQKDIPLAKELKIKEEKVALEERFHRLSVLQQQAEEDAKLAKRLSEKYEHMGIDETLPFDKHKKLRDALFNDEEEELNYYKKRKENGKDLSEEEGATGGGGYVEVVLPPPSPSKSNIVCDNDFGLPVPGASGYTPPAANKYKREREEEKLQGTYAVLDFEHLNSRKGGGHSSGVGASCSYDYDEEIKRKILQEESDAALAKKLQEELEQLEKDKQLAIETQDRELAKLLHEKEKARLKRAKERAKLKSKNNEQSEGMDEGTLTEGNNGIESISQKSHSSSSLQSESSNDLNLKPCTSSSISKKLKSVSPPKIPEKTHQDFDFRASPKPLPPYPNPSSNNLPPLPLPFDGEPIPPYMPLQGLKSSAKKKNQK